MTKQDVADIIRETRIKSGLTQQDAADRLGRKRTTLVSWETGRSQPDANTLFELFDIYGASVDEAFGFVKETALPAFDHDTIEFAEFYAKLDSGDRREARGFVRALLTKPQYKNKMNAEVAKDFGA